jgi:hypothetical protein
MPFKLKIKLR